MFPANVRPKMRYLKDEALVLVARPWRESSLILDLFTARHGKLGLVSKGVRRLKSYIGAYHRTGALVEVIWLPSLHSSLQTLVAVDPISLFTMPQEWRRWCIAVRLLTLANATLPPAVPHSAGFHQLFRTLTALPRIAEPELLEWQ